MDEHVRMLGFVPDDDLPIAYAAADMTIVPSVELEGFGLIVVESLASGTPAFVTPVGGLPDAVRGLSPDLILQGTDSASIAKALTDALRSRMTLPTADACRLFAQSHYDWSVIAPKIRMVYEEAIAETNRS
jgi:glycosyltransferase involved in cell wall biosynthesis